MGLIVNLLIGTAVASGVTSVGASYVSDLQVNDKIEALQKETDTSPVGSTVPTETSIVLIPGPKGDTGEKGERGQNGQDGLNGAQGIPGIPGREGTPGISGNNGLPGINGTNGSRGDKGDTGDTGSRGPRGFPGRPGRNGTNGIDGPPGPNCPVGFHLEQISLHQRAPVDQDLPVIVCVEDIP